MSRQLKISNDVHTMLSLFKPNSDTSFDWVIKMLIENVDPSLPYKVGRINRLYKDDPDEWTSQMVDLQEYILENFIVDFMSSKKERDQQVAEEMADIWEQDASDEAERLSEDPG